MKTNRRSFIKIASAGTGGLMLSTPAFNWLKDEEPIDDTKVKRFPTYCEVCFWKCAGWAYVKENGDLWKVVGNDDDQHSLGRFCPRGTGGVGMYHDKDRLKTPLMRVKGKDGAEDTFKKVSWDEALDFVADKMKKIAEEHGPDSLALLTHGSGGGFLKPLMHAFGSDKVAKPSYAQCRGPREVGFKATFGKGIGSPEPTDIKNTKCLVLIGAHIGENMHNAQVQELAQAIDNGATIITVDPRYSTVASKSKHWLPIKPSTDIALMLAWMNVLITNKWYNVDFVEKHTYGFEQLKAYVAPFTPAWAYGITEIKPEVIIETARAMSNAAPSVIIHPGRHVTWYGDDTQRARAEAILNALLGSWGAKGGFYMPEGIKVPHMEPYPKKPKSKHDENEGLFPMAGSKLANKIVDASVPSDKDWRIRGWIVDGTNLLTTMPNQENTKKAINALDLLVVIDTMPAEIVSYADVVLPECTYLERYDLIRSNGNRTPNIALRMPAVKPLYESKSAAWMTKQLAKRLGLEKYFPWKDERALLAWQLKEMGTSLEEMEKIGVKNFDRKKTELFPDFYEGYEFNTGSGKIELYSTSMEENGFDPMPKYTAHPEPPESFYRLNYGRAPMHTFSRTVNTPTLNSIMSENVLWVNPKVLKDWGLKNADEIWLENQDGVVSEFSIKIRATERIRYDNVYMVHGFGQNQKDQTRAYGRGINDQQLITRVMVDPIMGGTGFRGNFVTFLTSKPKPKKEEAKA